MIAVSKETRTMHILYMLCVHVSKITMRKLFSYVTLGNMSVKKVK